MTAPVSIVLAVIGLIVSANTKLHAVIAGQPVTIPVLWLVFATAVLALLALILHLIRVLATEFRKEPEPEPRPVHVITTLR